MSLNPCTITVTLTDDTEITLDCQQMPWTYRTFTVFDEGKGKDRFTYIPTERIDSFDVQPKEPARNQPRLAFSE
jgi:hypothetical protein